MELVTIKSETNAKYDEAVAEGKAIVERVKSDLWRLAEIVYNLESEYGEHTLERYAEDVGLSVRTLWQYQKVYARFGRIDQKYGRPAFWTLHQLVNVPEPEAERILEEKPDITFREARAIAKEYKERKPPDMSKWHSCSTNPIPLPTSLQESRVNHAMGLLLDLSYSDLKVLIQRIQAEEAKLWKWIHQLMN